MLAHDARERQELHNLYLMDKKGVGDAPQGPKGLGAELSHGSPVIPPVILPSYSRHTFGLIWARGPVWALFGGVIFELFWCRAGFLGATGARREGGR